MTRASASIGDRSIWPNGRTFWRAAAGSSSDLFSELTAESVAGRFLRTTGVRLPCFGKTGANGLNDDDGDVDDAERTDGDLDSDLVERAGEDGGSLLRSGGNVTGEVEDMMQNDLPDQMRMQEGLRRSVTRAGQGHGSSGIAWTCPRKSEASRT